MSIEKSEKIYGRKTYKGVQVHYLDIVRRVIQVVVKLGVEDQFSRTYLLFIVEGRFVFY